MICSVVGLPVAKGQNMHPLTVISSFCFVHAWGKNMHPQMWHREGLKHIPSEVPTLFILSVQSICLACTCNDPNRDNPN